MSEWILAALSCFGLGVMTTLHPCPLTTNLAAISLLQRWLKNKHHAVITSILFIGGYLSAYLIISMVVSLGILNVPTLSFVLQKIITTLLGPILILVGMVLADLIGLHKFYKGRILQWVEQRSSQGFHAFPLGVLLALSFCPATAALFFGVLIPLAIQQSEVVLFPLIYALGVSIPLVGIAMLVHRGGKTFLPDRWHSRIPVITGWILILIGIYLTVKNVYLAG